MKKRVQALVIALCIITSLLNVGTVFAVEDERISLDYVKIFTDALNNKILKDKSYRKVNFIDLYTGGPARGVLQNEGFDLDKWNKFDDAYIIDYDNDNQPELIVAFNMGMAKSSIIYEYDIENEQIVADKGFHNFFGVTMEGVATDIFYRKDLGFYFRTQEYTRGPGNNGIYGVTDFKIIKFNKGVKENLFDLRLAYGHNASHSYNWCDENTIEGATIKTEYEKLTNTTNYADDVTDIQVCRGMKGKEIDRYYTAPIKVVLNQSEVKMDVYPTVTDYRTLVPIRSITEAMGCTVEWDNENQKATISRGDIYVEAWLDKNEITVHNYFGEPKIVSMDAVPTCIDNRILIPVRALCECLGCEVTWDAEKRTVFIDYDLYPLQHASFTDNTQYALVTASGWDASKVKQSYIDNNILMKANKFWHGITMFKDGVTLQFPELADNINQDEIQYDAILNDLLMRSAVAQSYTDVLTQEYNSILVSMLDSYVFSEKEDEEIQQSESKIRAAAREALNGGVNKAKLANALNDYLELAADVCGGKSIADILTTLPKTSKGYKAIEAAAGVSGIGLDAVEEITKGYGYFADGVKAVALTAAIQKADERFVTVLERLSDDLVSSGAADTDDDEIEKGFTEAIDRYIESFNAKRKENTNAVVSEAMNQWIKQGAKVEYEIGRYVIMSGMASSQIYNMFSKVAPNATPKAGSIFAGVSMGMDWGVSMSEALFNTTDTAFNQDYVIKLGVLAEAMSKTVEHYETELVHEPTREEAEIFDCAYNMYRNIQLSAYDIFERIEDSLIHDTTNIVKARKEMQELVCH